jgi:NAD(P)H-hydrate epimerase
VLTPHDGEYTLLSGNQPGIDRMVAARRLAADSGCTVLLKGAATIVADPDGTALVVTAGDARLATAGTGDVLSGLIGALLAGGMTPLHAAAAAAWVHGLAGRRGSRHGLVASDLPDLIPAVLEDLL